MENEKYIEYITKMLNTIEDNTILKKIYEFVHYYFIRK